MGITLEDWLPHLLHYGPVLGLSALDRFSVALAGLSSGINLLSSIVISSGLLFLVLSGWCSFEVIFAEAGLISSLHLLAFWYFHWGALAILVIFDIRFLEVIVHLGSLCPRQDSAVNFVGIEGNLDSAGIVSK